MSQKSLFCWLLCGALLLSSDGRGQQPREEALAERDYVVFAAALPALWPVRVAKATSLVLLRETHTPADCLPTGPLIDEAWREAITDYVRSNVQPRYVVPGRDVGMPYVVSPRKEIDSLLSLRAPGPGRDWSWDAFHERHPDSRGYIQTSAVGFDRLMTRAVVHLTHACGSLCGGSAFHLLVKVESNWRLLQPTGFNACATIS
jgi:hypothetical protein